MQRFSCPICGVELFHADLRCLSCGADVALEPSIAAFGPLDRHVPCANRSTIDCNWRARSDVPAPGDARRTDLCRACVLTSAIPPLHIDEAVRGWREAESAKRRLVLQLLALGLLAEVPSFDDPEFRMHWSADGSVTIGHDDGVITIDVGEADDERRERLRNRLAEPYRTVLGHLRHEIGHFYWPRLADLPGGLGRLRAAFGDETADYASALDDHYDDGGSNVHPTGYVSEYATMHPWEDWAESFAHYLHQRDVLDTAARFGVVVAWATLDGVRTEINATIDGVVAFDELERQWSSLAVMGNALNRSMDQPDLYPFARNPTVVAKIELVHDLIAQYRY